MRHKTAATAATLLLLTGCGGGGSAGSGDDGGGLGPDASLWQQRTAASDRYTGFCAAPRSGNDPYNDNLPYPDRQGSIEDEKLWLKTYMHEVYLWNDEIPDAKASRYTAAAYGSVPAALDAYLYALTTPKVTASGKLKDAYSFTYPTDQWNALSTMAVGIGYGMQVTLLANTPPRSAIVVYTDADTPAFYQSIRRGAEVLTVDGVDLINDNTRAGVDTIYAGLYPATAGESHTFTLRDRDGVIRNVTLVSASLTSVPVERVQILDTSAGRVGYLVFKEHFATAEGQLAAALERLRDAGITDLVLDMRYNGGGYLDIASELAFMIAGQARSNGRVFEQLRYNATNPLARSPDSSVPFHATSQGFDPSLASGATLPELGLSRVFVLAGPGTCSASESLINGLRGIGVQAVLIGGTTCGKPYGFYAQDNCGLSYFAIELSGVNDQGFGDYADGFAPDCRVNDDYAHELGDPNEALLATALNWQQTGTCGTSSATRAAAAQRPASETPQLLRSPLHENAWRRSPR
ncbi:S41 family peptidase [uncultured Nevskia sp.]|uniref:S41 family peptidase n=1 Tax=uncultured Nevskia sp. TaxID=228950 RepID=UPI0025FE3A66|nr:S41 family peptidase [uncultured Nevskia sp.]